MALRFTSRRSVLMVTGFILAVTAGTQPYARAQERLVMNELSPFMNDRDIAIEPSLLTVDDLPRDKQKPPAEDHAADEAPDRKPSAIEAMYRGRVVDPLEQFGYTLFGSLHGERDNGSHLPAGAVQDDFVLNIGDELSVVLRGQKLAQSTYTVTGEGMLVIDDLPPVMAAGRTIKQIRDQLRDTVAPVYNTDIYISLSKVRQVSVLVAGHVKQPGRQVMTGFDTALDALMAAGGVEKTGTLRQIRLIRDGRTQIIDLYGLLIYGNTGVDIAIRDGDKIMVPPLGPTIAVSGAVKRPGIYEILPALQGMWHQPERKSQKLALNDLLDMAGGTLTPGQNRFMKLALTPDGEEQVETVQDPFGRQFGDGAILTVARGAEKREGTVQLVGHTGDAGIHALDETPTLSSLLAEKTALGPDIYPLAAVIERWNPETMSQIMLPFSPRLVAEGAFDRQLQEGDTVHLFSNAQIAALSGPRAEKIIENGDADPDDDAAPDSAIAAFLTERAVFVRGAVRKPGPYPVADGATLESVVAAAGGYSLEANTRNIEITSALQGEGPQSHGRSGTRRLTVDLATTGPGDVPLQSGDTVRVNQKFRKVEDNHVQILGEVANPGTYDLMPGDTLKKLLDRAGGVTNQAYPDGAIFSRLSERKREEARFRAQARDLELKLATMLEQTGERDKKPDPAEIGVARDLIVQLKQADALGRITVEADPGMLADKPELDLLLESGDRIYIPKRPMTVRVAGEVLSPAALQFRSEKAPRDYINQAGGYTYNADKDRAFVVYPDGSAQPLSVSAWTRDAALIPPGSTIVVPRDPKPLDFIDGAKDLSQIFANLATTIIFADEFGEDD